MEDVERVATKIKDYQAVPATKPWQSLVNTSFTFLLKTQLAEITSQKRQGTHLLQVLFLLSITAPNTMICGAVYTKRVRKNNTSKILTSIPLYPCTFINSMLFWNSKDILCHPPPFPPSPPPPARRYSQGKHCSWLHNSWLHN